MDSMYVKKLLELEAKVNSLLDMNNFLLLVLSLDNSTEELEKMKTFMIDYIKKTGNMNGAMFVEDQFNKTISGRQEAEVLGWKKEKETVYH